MFKRLLPLLILLLDVLLDTAVIPVFYSGQLLFPITLVSIMLFGILLGRLSGMFYGLISGLLLDITAGTVGLKVFPFIGIGFLIGFLLDGQPELTRSISRKDRLQYLAVRAIWIAVLILLYEIIMLVIQYMNTAVFAWGYVLNALLRTLIATAICMLLHPLYHRFFFGRARNEGKRKRYREVKRY